MPIYKEDQELKDVGDLVIDECRQGLKSLNICYLFRDEASVSQGKTIAGRCVRVDDRQWPLHKYDVLIEIAQDVWEQAGEKFQKALMDHELGHIGLDLDESGQPKRDDSGRIKVRMLHHDVEEFSDVLARHGAYAQDLRDFLSAHAVSVAKKDTTTP